MTTTQLYKELNAVNHARAQRLYYANLLLDAPELIPSVLDILFKTDDPLSCKAAWILEFMCGKNLNALLPHLDAFTLQMHTVHLDSAVRPVAKICEYLAKANNNTANTTVRTALTTQHKERIVTVCFDYMINNEKVAAKAYSMTTLYLLGKEFDWIHAELEQILKRDFLTQSAAYKARAKHILKQIKKR
ncbi:adenylosuccinate lyase [Formosa sediminum]|uniref:Adenylosuccinate lyase n=1 Tax=Formosa sediminum TaxID=2594004 RepID=A0A516GV62_9FLAO|nr:adenylosuccinate lyase [Formosa sediminum]QDO95409.1 adenylosuccinate lyase [Formosa sediminum]